MFEVLYKLPGSDIQLKDVIVPGIPNPTDPSKKIAFDSFGSVVGVVLPYIFYIAVFIAFIMFIFGGFQWMTSGGDPKATQTARGRITSALIGLVLIFVAYWLMRMLGVIFHISIF